MSHASTTISLLRSASLIGLSTIVIALLGLLRNKVIALTLGPNGMGVLGILVAISTTAASIAGMGLAGSGARYLAVCRATYNPMVIEEVKTLIRRMGVVFGAIGSLMILLFAGELSVWLLQTRKETWLVQILAVAVLATVVNSSQIAILRGSGCVGKIAALNGAGALGATLVGLPILWLAGVPGILAILVAGSAVQVIVGYHLLRSEQNIGQNFPTAWLSHLRPILTVGTSMMLVSFLPSLSQLLAKGMVSSQLSITAVGYLQAVWAIAAVSVGMLLSAMAVDYYPRLSGLVASERVQAQALTNTQSELLLLVSGPAFFAIFALAPQLLHLLYSKDFIVVESLLRWQLVAEMVRIVSWPIGYVALAAGSNKWFLSAELLTNGLFLAGCGIALSAGFGLVGVVLATTLSLLLYFAFSLMSAKKTAGIRLQRRVLMTDLCYIVIMVFLLLSETMSPVFATVASGIATIGVSIYAWRRVLAITGQKGVGGLLRSVIHQGE